MKIEYVLTVIVTLALVTYASRVLPFLLFRKKIESPFFRSFLVYTPYTVLAALIIPGIFTSTSSVISAGAGLAVSLVLSYFKKDLLTVSLAAVAVVYVCETAMRYI